MGCCSYQSSRGEVWYERDLRAVEIIGSNPIAVTFVQRAHLGVVKLGITRRLGRRDRWFESSHLDLLERQANWRWHLSRKQMSLLMSMRRKTLFVPNTPWTRFAQLGAEKSLVGSTPTRSAVGGVRHKVQGVSAKIEAQHLNLIPYPLRLTAGDWCSGSARQPLKLKVAARHRDPLLVAVECDGRTARSERARRGSNPCTAARAIGEVVSHLAYTQKSKVRFLDCPLLMAIGSFNAGSSAAHFASGLPLVGLR